MARKTTASPDPSVKDALRAIQRAALQMSPLNLFRMAGVLEVVAYGQDRGRWFVASGDVTPTPDRPGDERRA